MSTARPSRLPLVAVALAALALGLLVVVLLMRGGGAAPSASVPFDDGTATAAQVVAAITAPIEPRGEGFDAGAVPAWRDLGLREGDVLIAVQGRAPDLRRRFVSDGDWSTLYLDVERAGRRLTIRRSVVGRVGDAAIASGLVDVPAPVPPSVAVPAATGSGSASPSVGSTASPLAASIERIDDTHYVIPRATIDAVLADPMTVNRSMRVVPAVRNGQPDGFKIYAIKAGSVPAALGLSNGDTINEVNGARITGLDSAMTAFVVVKGARAIELRGTRRGKPLELHYKIK